MIIFIVIQGPDDSLDISPQKSSGDLFSEQLSHLHALQKALGIQQDENPLATEETLIFLLLVEFSFKWAEIQTLHSPLLLPLPAAAEGNADKAPKA